MNRTIKLSLLTTLLLTNNLIAEERLEDITVTSATKTEQNLADVTSNVNVITAQEIEERHYTTVTEALNSLPGVSFTRNGGVGKSTSFNLRGMDSRHTLILVDGVRYQDPSNTTGASIQHLVISDIEKIEVIKGAQSGIWGADATAGVINIITKKAKEGIGFYGSQEFGSFNTSKTDLGLSYKNKDFYIKATHTDLDSNGFTALAPKGQDINNFEDDGYSNKTSSIQAGINIAKNGKLEVGHTNIKGVSQYDSFGNPNDKKMKSDIHTKLSHIKYSHKVGINNIQIKHEISDFEREEVGTTSGVKNFNGKTTNSEINDQIGYGKDAFLLIGSNQQKTDVDYVKVDNSTNQDNYKSNGIFLTNSNKFASNTTLTQSIRYDNYNHFDNKTTGKFGIKHITNFGLIIDGNYGTAYTTPNIIQVLNPFGATNQNLQPEETKSFDISVEHYGLKLTYFDQKIDNLIDWYDPDGFGGVAGKYKNLSGTSKIKGYEVAYSNTLGDSFLANLSYTRLNAKDKDGKTLANRAKENIKFGIDYYGIEKLYLGVNGEYVGDRKQYLYGGGEVQTGNYTIANFTANYDWDKHLSFYGKVDNITDKYYQTVDGYATSPRAFYAGMKLTY